MNEEELEKLDRIIEDWRGGDTSSYILREKIVELVNGITIKILTETGFLGPTNQQEDK